MNCLLLLVNVHARRTREEWDGKQEHENQSDHGAKRCWHATSILMLFCHTESLNAALQLWRRVLQRFQRHTEICHSIAATQRNQPAASLSKLALLLCFLLHLFGHLACPLLSFICLYLPLVLLSGLLQGFLIQHASF